MTFIQGRKKRVAKEFEAHHLLCVACVTEFIGKSVTIKKIVPQTQWCINARPNMYPMPLWGHTIKHYCDLAGGGTFMAAVLPPPFANVPQHDYDHNSLNGYTTEVGKELKDLANECEKMLDKHEDIAKQLADALSYLSGYFKSALQARGLRMGGTHAAWQQGSAKPESDDWSMPFSMADDGNVQKRTFPVGGLDNKLAQKIQNLAKALLKWGA
ncbi:MAG: hypothetical protein ABMA01_02500 [Chthoniobacteraceae bacterium]